MQLASQATPPRQHPSTPPITDAASWHAAEIGARAQYEQRWTGPMLAEIDAAIAGVRHLAPEAITRESFPLHVCKPLLAETFKVLDSGVGFAVIAGFPVEAYEREDAVRAFCGVSSYLGDVVDQTSKRERVIDVTDRGKPYDGNSRGYHSNKMLPFHTDGAYLAGLLCLETAHQGGESLLASSMTAYNEVLRRYPERMQALTHGYFHDRRGDHAPGEHPVSHERIPVFSVHNNLLHCCYNRNGIVWAQAKTGMQLTDAEVAGLDAIDEIVADPQIHLRMEMQKGDMQFINNFVILHSRTEYTDHADGRHRHLVRLWLDAPQGRRRGPTLLDIYTSSDRRFAQV